MLRFDVFGQIFFHTFFGNISWLHINTNGISTSRLPGSLPSKVNLGNIAHETFVIIVYITQRLLLELLLTPCQV